MGDVVTFSPRRVFCALCHDKRGSIPILPLSVRSPFFRGKKALPCHADVSMVSQPCLCLVFLCECPALGSLPISAGDLLSGCRQHDVSFLPSLGHYVVIHAQPLGVGQLHLLSSFVSCISLIASLISTMLHSMQDVTNRIISAVMAMIIV